MKTTMETSESKVIQAISEKLKALNFKKRRYIWVRDIHDMKQVIWLENSTWHTGFYLRYGLDLKKKPRPENNKIDVEWATAEKLLSDRNIELENALNFDKQISAGDRILIVGKVIEELILPTFDQTNSIEKLRLILRQKYHPLCTTLTSFLPAEL